MGKLLDLAKKYCDRCSKLNGHAITTPVIEDLSLFDRSDIRFEDDSQVCIEVDDFVIAEAQGVRRAVGGVRETPVLVVLEPDYWIENGHTCSDLKFDEAFFGAEDAVARLVYHLTKAELNGVSEMLWGEDHNQ